MRIHCLEQYKITNLNRFEQELKTEKNHFAIKLQPSPITLARSLML